MNIGEMQRKLSLQNRVRPTNGKPGAVKVARRVREGTCGKRADGDTGTAPAGLPHHARALRALLAKLMTSRTTTVIWVWEHEDPVAAAERIAATIRYANT